MPKRSALFAPDSDGRLVPAKSARSPWADNMLHGRLIAALAARAAEDRARGFIPPDSRSTCSALRRWNRYMCTLRR
jgi:hypothetical protein